MKNNKIIVVLLTALCLIGTMPLVAQAEIDISTADLTKFIFELEPNAQFHSSEDDPEYESYASVDATIKYLAGSCFTEDDQYGTFDIMNMQLHSLVAFHDEGQVGVGWMAYGNAQLMLYGDITQEELWYFDSVDMVLMVAISDEPIQYGAIILLPGGIEYIVGLLPETTIKIQFNTNTFQPDSPQIVQRLDNYNIYTKDGTLVSAAVTKPEETEPEETEPEVTEEDTTETIDIGFAESVIDGYTELVGTVVTSAKAIWNSEDNKVLAQTLYLIMSVASILAILVLIKLSIRRK